MHKNGSIYTMYLHMYNMISGPYLNIWLAFLFNLEMESLHFFGAPLGHTRRRNSMCQLQELVLDITRGILSTFFHPLRESTHFGTALVSTLAMRTELGLY